MASVTEICTDQTLLDMARTLGLTDANAVFFPGREEIKVPTPARFMISPVRRWVKSDPRFEGGIRLHHAEAHKAWDQGHNVVITTGTGSGKSIIYMLEAMNMIMTDPTARIIALYPTQALNADQQTKWQEAASFCGLPKETIGIIDGRVLGAERPEILRNARVLVTTPDSLDVWLLANLDMAVCRDFVRQRRLTIIDEAHLNVGALGSNVMYTLRRLEMVQRWLNPNFTNKTNGRFMAASATIDDPTEFLKTLTGHSFVEIGEEFNGAHIHPKLIMAAPNPPSYYADKILEDLPDKQFLVFVDSRNAVEEFAGLYPDTVVPYKSGMSREFQKAVEFKLRHHRTRGVVATSALEVGVDLSFDIGMNDGLPANIGRALQRIGRTGRHGPGLFVFSCGDQEFEEYGSDIANYLRTPLQPVTLYPTNEFIQFAHALRLKRERKQISENVRGADVSLQGMKWPARFGGALKLAHLPPAEIPWHLRGMIPSQGVTPHRYNGMRAIGGMAWRLGKWDRLVKRYEDLGSTHTVNAFFEYPPGAIVRHQGKRWRVRRWTQNRSGMVIDMRPLFASEKENTTKFQHITYGQAHARDEDELLSRRLMIDPKKVTPEQIGGLFVGEVKFRLHLALTHFLENFPSKKHNWGTKRVNYHDDEDLARLNAEAMGTDIHDYGPRRRFLIDTTGVVIHLPIAQFGKGKKRNIARAIIDEYCETYNCDHADIGYQEGTTRFLAPDGQSYDAGNLVIYDRTAGSLRLSRHLVTSLPSLVKRAMAKRKDKLKKETAKHRAQGGTKETSPRDVVLHDLEWFVSYLNAGKIVDKATYMKARPTSNPQAVSEQNLPDGYIKVIPPDTKADWVRAGIAQRVKILEPRVADGVLYYEVFAVDRYSFFSRARSARFERLDAIEGYTTEDMSPYVRPEGRSETRFLPAHEIIMTSGRYVGFNPETNHYIELQDGAVTEDISAAMEERISTLRHKQVALKQMKAAEVAADPPAKPHP